MSLENLIKRKNIIPHQKDTEEIKKFLRQAENYYSDSQQRGLRAERKLECAYDAVRLFIEVALRAKGYLPRRDRGRHLITIETFRHTVGADDVYVARLHTLRTRRHTIKYDAELISPKDARDAVKLARDVRDRTLKWLRVEIPELFYS